MTLNTNYVTFIAGDCLRFGSIKRTEDSGHKHYLFNKYLLHTLLCNHIRLILHTGVCYFVLNKNNFCIEFQIKKKTFLKCLRFEIQFICKKQLVYTPVRRIWLFLLLFLRRKYICWYFDYFTFGTKVRSFAVKTVSAFPFTKGLHSCGEVFAWHSMK